MESGAYIIDKIEEMGILERYSPGETIFEYDTLPEFIYYIRKGSVLVIDPKLEGNVDMLTVSMGNILGLADFLSGSLYRISAYSETESFILQMERKSFEILFMEDVLFRTEIVKQLSAKFLNQNTVFE